jgi:hypothetical protein
MTKLAALLVAIALASCSIASTPQPTLAVVPSPSPAAIPSPVSATPDACTTTASKGEDVLAALFRLASSADARSVADCYAASYRSKYVSTFNDVAARWSQSGPAQVFNIRKIDRVQGCERFAVEAELDRGHTVAWIGRMTVFYSVGLDAGRMRIWDGGTALAAPEYTTIVCG